MSKRLSKSPQRHTFLYKDEPEWDDWLNQIKEEDEKRSKDPEWQKNNLEYDLRTTEWILEKVRNSEVYAQHLYAAMCNNDFRKNETWPILQGQVWGCSWRYAGGIIADMREEGDYINWYCSGIGGDDINDEQFQQMTKDDREHYLESKLFVGEGVVTNEIRRDLLNLGWIVIDDSEVEV